MINNANSLTLRYLKAQKKRTMLTIVGIILSAALITAIGTIVVSMRDKLIRDAIIENGDYHAELSGVNGDIVNKIKNNVDVKSSAISKQEKFAIMSDISDDERRDSKTCPPYRYLSINEFDKDMFNVFNIILKEGRLPEKQGEIAVEYWAADYLGGKPKIGDRIKIDTGLRKNINTGKYLTSEEWSSSEVFEKKEEKEFTIVGFIKPNLSWATGYIAQGIAYFDSSNLVEDQKYNIFIKMNSQRNIHRMVEKAAENAGVQKSSKKGGVAPDITYNERVLRLSAQSLDPNVNRALILTLVLIILLVVVSTIAVIYNAFNISVLERISQFGVLRCTGASPTQIRNIVLKEAGLLSIAGIPLGLVFGVAAMKIVLFIIGRLRYVYEIFQGMTIIISPVVLLTGVIIGVTTVFLSALGPARRASKVSPLEAVRNSGAIKKENFSNVWNIPFAKVLFRIEGYIASKNIRRNRKRFKITVFSMVVSIVLYISFGSFVGYMFKMEAVGDKDALDFTVWRNGTVNKGIEPSIYNDIRNLEGVEAVYKGMNVFADVLVPSQKLSPKFKELKANDLKENKGDSIVLHNNMIRCYGDDALPSLKQYLKSGSIDLNNLNKENGVIIVQKGKLPNERSSAGALIDITEFKAGDTISFKVNEDDNSSKDKPYMTAKVMAVLNQGVWPYKYNENGGIYIVTSENIYEKLTGGKYYENIYIKLAAVVDNEVVTKYLKELNEKDFSYQYKDYVEAAKKERYAAFAVSIFLYGFVAVITLIGCVNIINTISTNLILRKRELSMLRAVGMTGFGIKKMVCAEGILYGINAAVIGGIIGTAVSYAFFRILIGVREFEWSIPWVQIFTAVIGTIAVTLLSSLVPLKRINNGNIIGNIRAEE